MISRCFWDSEYIASQPFCITSKLTEKEHKDLVDFEELKFWEGIELLKSQLRDEIFYESDEPLEEELLQNDRLIDVEKAVDLFFLAPKKYVFTGFKSEQKSLGLCNTQTSGRRLPKTALKRSDFLSR